VVINQCVFEICAQRNLLPSFVAAGICDLHMQMLKAATQSLCTPFAQTRGCEPLRVMAWALES
jgi:hypothetical protein